MPSRATSSGDSERETAERQYRVFTAPGVFSTLFLLLAAHPRGAAVAKVSRSSASGHFGRHGCLLPLCRLGAQWKNSYRDFNYIGVRSFVLSGVPNLGYSEYNCEHLYCRRCATMRPDFFRQPTFIRFTVVDRFAPKVAVRRNIGISRKQPFAACERDRSPRNERPQKAPRTRLFSPMPSIQAHRSAQSGTGRTQARHSAPRIRFLRNIGECAEFHTRQAFRF